MHNAKKEKFVAILLKLSKFKIKYASVHVVYGVPKSWKLADRRPVPCNHFRFRELAPKISINGYGGYSGVDFESLLDSLYAAKNKNIEAFCLCVHV